MNRNIFCSRKGGATINGKFIRMRNTEEILAADLERKNNKMEKRQEKRHRYF